MSLTGPMRWQWRRVGRLALSCSLLLLWLSAISARADAGSGDIMDLFSEIFGGDAMAKAAAEAAEAERSSVVFQSASGANSQPVHTLVYDNHTIPCPLRSSDGESLSLPITVKVHHDSQSSAKSKLDRQPAVLLVGDSVDRLMTMTSCGAAWTTGRMWKGMSARCYGDDFIFWQYSSPGMLFGPGKSTLRLNYLLEYASNMTKELGRDPDAVVFSAAFWDMKELYDKSLIDDETEFLPEEFREEWLLRAGIVVSELRRVLPNTKGWLWRTSNDIVSHLEEGKSCGDRCGWLDLPHIDRFLGQAASWGRQLAAEKGMHVMDFNEVLLPYDPRTYVAYHSQEDRLHPMTPLLSNIAQCVVSYATSVQNAKLTSPIASAAERTSTALRGEVTKENLQLDTFGAAREGTGSKCSFEKELPQTSAPITEGLKIAGLEGRALSILVIGNLLDRQALCDELVQGEGREDSLVYHRCTRNGVEVGVVSVDSPIIDHEGSTATIDGLVGNVTSLTSGEMGSERNPDMVIFASSALWQVMDLYRTGAVDSKTTHIERLLVAEFVELGGALVKAFRDALPNVKVWAWFSTTMRALEPIENTGRREVLELPNLRKLMNEVYDAGLRLAREADLLPIGAVADSLSDFYNILQEDRDQLIKDEAAASVEALSDCIEQLSSSGLLN